MWRNSRSRINESLWYHCTYNFLFSIQLEKKIALIWGIVTISMMRNCQLAIWIQFFSGRFSHVRGGGGFETLNMIIALGGKNGWIRTLESRMARRALILWVRCWNSLAWINFQKYEQCWVVSLVFFQGPAYCSRRIRLVLKGCLLYLWFIKWMVEALLVDMIKQYKSISCSSAIE